MYCMTHVMRDLDNRGVELSNPQQGITGNVVFGGIASTVDREYNQVEIADRELCVFQTVADRERRLSATNTRPFLACQPLLLNGDNQIRTSKQARRSIMRSADSEYPWAVQAPPVRWVHLCSSP